jgi:hypothetical protein
VFIDGDHLYDGVKTDWENYGPMGSKYVVFHDICGDIHGSGYGGVEVCRFWHELKSKKGYQFEEFIGLNSPMGIGRVTKSGSPSAVVQPARDEEKIFDLSERRRGIGGANCGVDAILV